MNNEKIAPGQIRYTKFQGDIAYQGGIRPAVIIQNHIGCIYSPRIWVIPLTSKVKKSSHLPMHIFIPKTANNGLDEDSVALVEQAKFVLKRNIGYLMGELE